LNEEKLSFERNLFIILFFVFWFSDLGSLFFERPDSIQIIILAGFLYITYRLSHFLKQQIWLTILYCTGQFFVFGSIIVFIGLMINVRNMRLKLREGSI